MNLFGTVLTYTAPSANYRGESAENRAVIQKITTGRHEYAIVSPEAIRNALREALATLGLPCNRKRLDDEEQLAVEFSRYPDADVWADDFFMGWLIATGDRDEHRERVALSDDDPRGNDIRSRVEELNREIAKAKSDKNEAKEKKLRKEKSEALRGVPLQFKRDSVLRMNMATALEPYRHDSVFTQSPLQAGTSPWKNADSSQLLHRETALTAYQYPFALNLEDCGRTAPKDEDSEAKALREAKVGWTVTLLKAIGELNDVAGNHARSYFEFAPASIALRLSQQLVAGFSTYGFHIEEDGRHTLPEVVEGILKGDFGDKAGSEFHLGGKLVKDMDKTTFDELTKKGVHLNRSPQQLLKLVGEDAFGK